MEHDAELDALHAEQREQEHWLRRFSAGHPKPAVPKIESTNFNRNNQSDAQSFAMVGVVGTKPPTPEKRVIDASDISSAAWYESGFVRPAKLAESCAHKILQWANADPAIRGLISVSVLGGDGLDLLLPPTPRAAMPIAGATQLSVKVVLSTHPAAASTPAPSGPSHWVPGHLKTRGRTDTTLASQRAAAFAAVQAVAVLAKQAALGPRRAAAAAVGKDTTINSIRVAAAVNPLLCRRVPLCESASVLAGPFVDFGGSPNVAVVQAKGGSVDPSSVLGASSQRPRVDWQCLEGHLLLHLIARNDQRHLAVGHAAVRVCDVFAGAVRAYASGASPLFDALHPQIDTAAGGVKPSAAPPLEYFVRLRVPLLHTHESSASGTAAAASSTSRTKSEGGRPVAPSTVAIELSFVLPGDVPLANIFIDPDRDFLRTTGGVVPPEEFLEVSAEEEALDDEGDDPATFFVQRKGSAAEDEDAPLEFPESQDGGEGFGDEEDEEQQQGEFTSDATPPQGGQIPPSRPAALTPFAPLGPGKARLERRLLETYGAYQGHGGGSKGGKPLAPPSSAILPKPTPAGSPDEEDTNNLVLSGIAELRRSLAGVVAGLKAQEPEIQEAAEAVARGSVVAAKFRTAASTASSQSKPTTWAKQQPEPISLPRESVGAVKSASRGGGGAMPVPVTWIPAAPTGPALPVAPLAQARPNLVAALPVANPLVAPRVPRAARPSQQRKPKPEPTWGAR